MGSHNDQNDLDRDSGEGDREDSYPQEPSCWDDFEYIETFLPRNIDY